MKLKTAFCERFFNLSPRVVIYDLDGTVIDSSHRIRLHENGSLDLEHWKQNSTRDMIFQDSLLPLYWQLVDDYKNGNIVVICTARNLGKYDWEYLHSMGIYYDYVISRPENVNTVDHVLKANQLGWLFRFKQFKDLAKSFYDDNLNNLKAVSELGRVQLIDAGKYNNRFSA